MDETPEELERIRQEAEHIDPYRYRRRRRAILAFFLGSFMAFAVWAVLELIDQRRNPCERVRDYLCAEDPQSLNCKTYQGIFKESVEDPSPGMRSQIRDQCLRKIKRMQEEQGVQVP